MRLSLYQYSSFLTLVSFVSFIIMYQMSCVRAINSLLCTTRANINIISIISKAGVNNLTVLFRKSYIIRELCFSGGKGRFGAGEHLNEGAHTENVVTSRRIGNLTRLIHSRL